MRSTPDPSLGPVPDGPRDDLAGVPWYATAEDVAYAAELAALDRADDAALRAEWAAAGLDVPGDDGSGPVGSGPAGDGWDDALAELADDDALVNGLQGPVHGADLMLLESIDPRGLRDPHTRVLYLQACDRVAARVASHRSAAVVALVGESSTEAYLPEVYLEHEVAVARRSSRYSAGRAMETARALATVFPGFAAALHAGEIAEVYCSILVERTRVVTDPGVLAAIERRVLPKARRLTPSQFAGEIAKAIAALDPGAAARHRRARESRRVWTRQLEDGMGLLGMTHEWPTIQAIAKRVRADGRALQLARRAAAAGDVADPSSLADPDVDASGATGSTPVDADMTAMTATVPDAGVDEDVAADACRADAFAAAMLGTRNEDGSTTWDRSNIDVVVNVVMDLHTLRGEADRVALLDGQPVPAEVGREVAAFGTWWRRLVTDPVDGHLLDYGRTQYLPDKLRRFVLARDGGCRTPYCGVHAESRLQLDHALEWPDGESSAANTGTLCTTCHQLKTAGHTDITDSDSDGSCTWRTAWGQTIHVPPRPVLDDPDPPPEPALPPLEPPPF